MVLKVIDDQKNAIVEYEKVSPEKIRVKFKTKGFLTFAGSFTIEKKGFLEMGKEMDWL